MSRSTMDKSTMDKSTMDKSTMDKSTMNKSIRNLEEKSVKRPGKNNLDERQEQALLKIEHNGCWIAFWGLLAVMAVQFLMNGPEGWNSIAGEWFVFMILSLYIVWGCEKEGIWDRRLKPDFKTNLLLSVIAGAAITVLTGLSFLRRFPDKPQGSFAAGGIFGIIAFAACLFGLQLAAAKYRKTVEEQETEQEEEE